MLPKITRIVVALLGVQFIALGFWLWLAPEVAAIPLGLMATGPAGLATLRADIGGVFLTMGAITAWAAWRQNGILLWPVMLFLGAAMMGRAITMLSSGLGVVLIAPFVIEAVLLALLVFAQRTLRTAPSA